MPKDEEITKHNATTIMNQNDFPILIPIILTKIQKTTILLTTTIGEICRTKDSQPLEIQIIKTGVIVTKQGT